MIGFGLAMLKKSLSEKQAVAFDLFTNIKANILDIFVVIITLIVLGVSMFWGATHKMTFNKGLAYCLGSIYTFFILGSTYLAFK